MDVFRLKDYMGHLNYSNLMILNIAAFFYARFKTKQVSKKFFQLT